MKHNTNFRREIYQQNEDDTFGDSSYQQKENDDAFGDSSYQQKENDDAFGDSIYSQDTITITKKPTKNEHATMVSKTTHCRSSFSFLQKHNWAKI